MKIDNESMVDVLHREHAFSDMFVAYLLTRYIRYEEDLVDQLFNSSEKRLARILLLLAHFGKDGKSETVIPKISQESLAEMVGTTRSRVSFFMNRFRELGLIDYHGGRCIASSQFTSQHRSPRLELRSEKTELLLSHRRTAAPLPFRDGSSVLLGPQMSAGPCGRRVASFASVEDPQHVGYEENQQYGAQPYARTPTITPAAMAVVPSTAP
jgi:hypothetical protein